jgi:hypothetical protein
MKKILMTLVAVFAAVSMNAQNEMYIGGNINYQSKTTVDNSLTIAPEFGVKLNEQWGVGAILSYKNEKQFNGDKDNAFTFNPYARYYALNIGKVNVFVDGGVYFTTKKTEYNAGGDNKSTEYGLRVTPGISYNITDQFSIVAHANPIFNLDIVSPDGGDTQTTINLLRTFNVNTFSFGFYYNF